MSAPTGAAAGGELVTYRGHTLRTKPPSDGIFFSHAARSYRVAKRVLWRWIDEGALWASLTEAGRGGPKILVSRQGVRRKVAVTNSRGNALKSAGPDQQPGPAPSDGVPVRVLARELGVWDRTIHRWCEWETHPALGQRVRSGMGTFVVTTGNGTRRFRGLLVSRADVATCVEMVNHPLNRPIPRNPGQWLAEDIFQHQDGTLFFTERYVERHKARYGLFQNALRMPAYSRRLHSLIVVCPGKSCPQLGPWKVRVYSAASIDRLAERRAGKQDGGEWLVFGEIWKDAAGLGFSSQHIAKQLKITRSLVHSRFRASGRLKRFKSVPLSKAIGGRHGQAVVHHESEVRPLLGLPPLGSGAREEASPTRRAPTKTANKADGPADPYLFHYKGRTIDLSGAPLRHRLLSALWDAQRGCPYSARMADEVLDEVYGQDADDEGIEKRLENLQVMTNKLIRKRLLLDIRSGGGKVWLREVK